MNKQQALAVAASAWNRYEATLTSAQARTAATPDNILQFDQIEVRRRLDWYSQQPQNRVFYNASECLAAAVELRRS